MYRPQEREAQDPQGQGLLCSNLAAFPVPRGRPGWQHTSLGSEAVARCMLAYEKSVLSSLPGVSLQLSSLAGASRTWSPSLDPWAPESLPHDSEQMNELTVDAWFLSLDS